MGDKTESSCRLDIKIKLASGKITRGFLVAAGPGLEPGPGDPKSPVLPVTPPRNWNLIKL